MTARLVGILSVYMLFASRALAISTIGLVAHWPLDGAGIDVSGNCNNLSVVGALPGNDRFGVSGGALELDAATSSLSLPDGAATDLVSQFSWLGWVRFDRIGTAADGFVAKTCCGSNTTTMFYADTYAWDGSRPNYNQIRFFVTAGGGNFGFEQAGPILQNHTWYHIALVYDGPNRTMKVYVNGLLTNALTNNGSGGINDVPSSLNNVDAPFAMGREPDLVASNGLQGALDDVWWFSRVLSDTEVAEIASLQNCQQQVQTLQSQVNTLTAQVSTLTAHNTALTQQLQSLQAQVVTLTAQNNSLAAQNAAINQQLQAVNIAVDTIENNLRSLFANPQFVITGNSAAERTQVLRNAILTLNRGHQEALYKALGGK